jgi:hypothetical protein
VVVELVTGVVVSGDRFMVVADAGEVLAGVVGVVL